MVTPEDFAEDKPKIDLEEFNKLQDALWEEHEYIKEEDRILKERKAKFEKNKAAFEVLLKQYDMTKAVTDKGTIRVEQRYSYKTPKENTDKVQLFNYIKEKYGKDTLMGMTGINSQTLNSWAKKEVQSALEDGVTLLIPGLESPSVSNQVKFIKSKG